MVASPSPSTVPAPQAGLGGTTQTYRWQWQGQTLTIAYETLGEGSPILLLPAFSTVSTRAELTALATGLAAQFQAIAVDWPGFGESSRLPLEYGPALYHQFLQDFVRDTFAEPVTVVAAGHAAGCAIRLARQNQHAWSRIVLVAPTWRGPLAVMGASQSLRNGVQQLVRSPFIGQTLYKLNTLPSFLHWMYRRHVYVDAAKLTPDFIDRRYRITQQSGARFAPAAFVTGNLDPVGTRAEFLAEVQSVAVPLLAIVAEQAPPASKAEMEAIAALSQVQVERLPGSLGLAEEFGAEVAAAILPWL